MKKRSKERGGLTVSKIYQLSVDLKTNSQNS